VTAAAFEVDQYDRAGMWRALPDELRADDSKQIFSRTTMAAAERDTLAWLAAFGAATGTHADLVRSVCLPIPWDIPCNGIEPHICRPDTAALPRWSEVGSDRAPARIAEQLGAGGVRPLRVRSLAACAGAFNRAVAEPDTNKLRLDFEMMLHLLTEIAEETGRELTAICGKVGSTRRYGPWLDGLGRFLWTALEEEPANSSYRISGLGTVSFVRDADSSHLPVAVASMIGKYLRELAMARLNDELGQDPSRPASGYRDPVTATFVEETAERREELGLEDRCFRRSC
jgi:hypothetical protein